VLKFAIRNWLPQKLRIPLWGDREKWGLTPNVNDSCWREWAHTYLDFYAANQRTGIGTAVNDAGYRLMSWIDMEGKRVLEIGPGDIRHMQFWNGRPSEYVRADIHQGMLAKASRKLEEGGVACRPLLLRRGEPLPLGDASVDVVVSFYSLEHIYPLGSYLEQISRVLRPGGYLIGAIPAEGGLAWGLGRMLTSRRWFKKNTTIDPAKIICWEHPNFADDIINELDRHFVKPRLHLWPMRFFPFIDANLIIRLLYQKRE
jgi:SAM-dependent methyltransferase